MRSNAFIFLSLLLLSFSAQAKILGWLPQTMSENEAQEVVTYNVEMYAQEVSSCDVEKIGFFEAIHHLKDIKGHPVLVIISEAELSGSTCQEPNYVDCRTVFKKDADTWIHDITFCEKPDQSRD